MARPRTKKPTKSELAKRRELESDPIRLAVVGRAAELGLNARSIEDRSAGTVSHDTVNRYLLGYSTPTGAKLSAILRVLGWDGEIRWREPDTQKSETPG